MKGGAHNVAGFGACDDGLMIDCSRMTGIQVDPDQRIVRAQPGVLIRDLDRETQALGLAVPGGFISSTGLAGLTLGGGFGYLSRRCGLTVDNLISVDLVTADGDRVRASDDQNAELFWGLKGGGGNFGVASSFEFRLHDLGPTVLAGPVVHDFDDAPEVLRQVSRVFESLPESVSCLPVLRYAPPAPFIPEQYHGRLILLLAMIHTGDPEAGESALAPLRLIGRPLADAVGPKPYCAFQAMFDKTAAHGARNYWKGHYLDELNDGAIDALCAQAARMPSKESSIGMLSLGGAVSRKQDTDSPYPHRSAQWVLNIQARWREMAEDRTHIDWARATFESVDPHATGGVYVNFLSEDEGEARVRAAYGEDTHSRLVALKRQWDPENRFHLNQNIRPGGS
ncbi:FAD-binding oxidoreductase [Saccharospirillum salsuginis]|nr:FAD-binding oxidoreductase [Saccharospirillum salsuginis]